MVILKTPKEMELQLSNITHLENTIKDEGKIITEFIIDVGNDKCLEVSYVNDMLSNIDMHNVNFEVLILDMASIPLNSGGEWFYTNFSVVRGNENLYIDDTRN